MRAFISVILFVFFPLAYSQDASLLLGGKVFQIDTAVTAQERAQGLMHRREMQEDYGMLFIYPEPRPVSFWMKETFVSLDILFFDRDGKLINFFTNVPPCTATPCPMYKSIKSVGYVLELKGGIAPKLALKPGDQFQITGPW